MKNLIDTSLEKQSVAPKAEIAGGATVTTPFVEPKTCTADTVTGVPDFLPKNYLDLGYHATTDKGAKYLRPEFVGEYAEQIATGLSIMRPSDFSTLLREMKRNRKKSLPFEARQTAAIELLPKAMTLVNRKKAPALLIDFIKDNLDHIHNDDDWTAFYRHLDAIYAYMLQNGNNN